ncbi:MAG: Asp-tRNA(Asn)/Glu-tRNA(Gln) amidotransferase subunit GatC [Deltaproteobacteria bacterium]|nr:MAG: Asp-tRNA(Asn)/Glu-tRNA(Gln) amidotransferase subunit GatC [Deltaproteobacteria bacterium]
MEIDIRHVARLARLELDAAEAARLGAQLGQILDYVAQLDGLDTADVPPTTHVLPVATPWREDAVTARIDREEVLAAAPEHDGEAFAVPKVV